MGNSSMILCHQGPTITGDAVRARAAGDIVKSYKSTAPVMVCGGPGASCMVPDLIMGASYVNYVPNLKCSLEGGVKVWWFPADFCQSRLGDRLIGGTGSNACTIITLLMAHKIHSLGIQIWGHEDQPLNRQLMSAFAESIIDGNDIHERLMASGPMRNPNLTLPEAMEACRGRFVNLVEWDSTVYHSKMRTTLFDNLHRGIMRWELQGMPPTPGCDLYIVLIADQRSVLLVFQRALNRVTLIDSHSHLQHGAVVAQAGVSQLKELCLWYDDMCWRFYESRPCCYELSYLYFQSPAFPSFNVRRLHYRGANSRW
uniref:Uncharacterized protein n=1 Tax=Strigamia maritima TaxID=126957 RepID=T1J4V4_STRMM